MHKQTPDESMRHGQKYLADAISGIEDTFLRKDSQTSPCVLLQQSISLKKYVGINKLVIRITTCFQSDVSVLFGQMAVLVTFPGMTIPDEDTEAGQTSKYCLVAIGRLQVCVDL